MTDDIKQDAAAVSAQFVTQWGAFRRFIAKHPFTGWLIGVGVGLGADELLHVLHIL